MVSNIVANTGVGNIDGIDRDNDGNYYIAHWSPDAITKYNGDFSSSETVSTPTLNSPADICYALAPDTLAIPGGNQVVFVGFETSVGLEEAIAAQPFRIFPNPASERSVISFELTENKFITLTLHDAAGKLIAEMANGEFVTGKHQVNLSGSDLTEGTYICKMNLAGSTTSSTFIYTK